MKKHILAAILVACMNNDFSGQTYNYTVLPTAPEFVVPNKIHFIILSDGYSASLVKLINN